MIERSDELLMRSLDGELAAEEAAEVERWVAESAEARALVRDLAEVREHVRAISRPERALDRAFTDLVMERALAPKVQVLPRGAAAGGAPSPVRRLPRLLPALGLALAAAAAALVLLRPTSTRQDGAGSASPAVPAVAAPVAHAETPPAEAVETDPDPGAEIEDRKSVV